MPKSAAPLWHTRSGQDLDQWVEASISQANWMPDETGRFATCVAAGLNEFCGHYPQPGDDIVSACWKQERKGNRFYGDKCEVHEFIRQLYNANHRRYVKKTRPITSLPFPQIVKADDGTHQIHYFLTTKEAGRAKVTVDASGDRSKLAYDPHKKNEKKKK